jgi:hypothetical protein
MASRDYTKHFVSNSAPSSSSLGDEWFNPSANTLYKRVANNGTAVVWVEVLLETNGVNLNRVQTLTNKTLTAPVLTTPSMTTPVLTGTREVKNVLAASDIDLSAGNYFTKTITAGTVFTLSNVPSAGTAISFILDLTNGGAFAITWFSGVKWASGTAPTLTASGRDCLGFFSHDGGVTWSGFVLGKAMA